MKKEKFEVLDFASVYDLARRAGENLSPAVDDFERKSHWITEERTEFTGVETFQDAAELVKNGYSVAIQEMESRKDFILSESEKKEYRYDVEGEFFDVGEVLSGAPEPWLREITEKGAPKHYKIIINCSIWHKITQSEIYNRGAAILAIIDSLASQGAILEIEGIIYVVNFPTGEKTEMGNDKRGAFLAKFPICNTPIDMDLLGFVLSHPAFLRRLWFGAMEKKVNIPNCGAYGNIIDAPREYTEGAIYFEQLTKHSWQWQSPENARLWVKEYLHGLNQPGAC